MLRTYLTTELGLRYPLIGAPMANLAGGELARAITQAGGLGMIGVGSRDSAEFVAREASAARRGNPDIRFGIGVMAWDVVRRPQLLAAVIAARPFLASVSFGTVGPHVARLHDAGILVTTQVHDSAETVAATEAGVDLIVVQGTEAGGPPARLRPCRCSKSCCGQPRYRWWPRGVSPPQRAWRPVWRRARKVCGWATAFIASPECGRQPAAIFAILAARETDTIRTHAFDRAQGIPWPAPFPGRALRNDFTDRWHEREDQMSEDLSAQLRYRAACERGDYRLAHIYAGQAVGLVQAARPAGEVVREIAEGAEVLLRARCAHLLY